MNRFTARNFPMPVGEFAGGATDRYPLGMAADKPEVARDLAQLKGTYQPGAARRRSDAFPHRNTIQLVHKFRGLFHEPVAAELYGRFFVGISKADREQFGRGVVLR